MSKDEILSLLIGFTCAVAIGFTGATLYLLYTR